MLMNRTSLKTNDGISEANYNEYANDMFSTLASVSTNIQTGTNEWNLLQ